MEVSVNLFLDGGSDVEGRRGGFRDGGCWHGASRLGLCREAPAPRQDQTDGEAAEQVATVENGHVAPPEIRAHHATVALVPCLEIGFSPSQSASPVLMSVSDSWKS